MPDQKTSSAISRERRKSSRPASKVSSRLQPLQMMTPIERATFLAGISDAEAALLLYDWPFWAREKQVPPKGDWRVHPRRTRSARPGPVPNGSGLHSKLAVVSAQPSSGPLPEMSATLW